VLRAGFAALFVLSLASLGAAQKPLLRSVGRVSLVKGGAIGGEPIGFNCIPDPQMKEAQRQVELYYALHGGPRPKIPAQTLGFFPQGGTMWGDLWVNNFTDVDPSSPGFIDFDGFGWTYDGHNGHDSEIRGFDEQTIGVPVYSVLGGTVIAAVDGNYDRNTVAGNWPANYVIIDHGNGQNTWYWHLKQGSILVGVGQPVVAGQQIASTGSSGSSTFPHLHFTAVQDGNWYEPSAGPMRPGASNWLNQIPVPRQMYLDDFNITGANPTGWPGPPLEWPRTGTFVAGSFNMWNWIAVRNLPAASTYRLVLKRPDGSVAIDSGPQPFNNSVGYRASYWIFGWNLNIPSAGQWTIQMFLNDTLMTEAPFTVAATAGDVVNRPPNPITAAIDPISPTLDLPVFCRVIGDKVLDDPDYDVVRYHFVWKVDGATVRDVITAGRADCVPKGALLSGHTISCTVTPSDASLSGPPTVAAVRLSPGTLSMFRGTILSGDLPELRFSDDARVSMKPGLVLNNSESPAQMIVESESFGARVTGFGGSLSSLSLTVESRMDENNVSQSIALYDFSAGQWETLDTRNLGTGDSVVTVTSSTLPIRFVEALTGKVRARLSYKAGGLLLHFPFVPQVDQVYWTESP
jgi:hypothetical protein